MKLIDENEIPGKLKRKGNEWLEILRKIPKGKAWAVTEEEAGIKAVSMRMMVTRLKKIGELPSNYKTMQRTVKGKVTIYIINSVESTKEEIEEIG
jgi:hypothetical protein